MIRSELASLQPSKYILMLSAANRANAIAAASNQRVSNKKLSKKASKKRQEVPVEGKSYIFL